MTNNEEFDGDLAIDDDGAVEVLAPFYDARPCRQAWRTDVESAPIGRPVYARAPNSVRVLIGMRDEQGWVAITRDGEMRPLDAVGSCAPLGSSGIARRTLRPSSA